MENANVTDNILDINVFFSFVSYRNIYFNVIASGFKHLKTNLSIVCFLFFCKLYSLIKTNIYWKIRYNFVKRLNSLIIKLNKKYYNRFICR